jgi:hypothetical protein
MKYFFETIIFVILCTCLQENTYGQKSGAYRDSIVTRFFQRTTGWIASDGALSVGLADGRTLWLMGDSYIDDYDTVTGTIPCLFQVRNAALLQLANSWRRADAETLTGDGPGIKSLFKTTSDDNFWFWPGNGIQLEDTVYIYCSELKREGEGTFGFAGTGNDVWAKMKYPEMEVVGYDALPDFDGIHFGAGFIKDENSGYVYAYGQKLIPMAGESEVFVARFPEDNPGLPWEFWNGSSWNKDVADVAAIGRAAISPHVSKVNGKYLLLSTQLSVACDQGKEIYASVSKHPTGPFSEMEEIYTIDDTLQGHYPFFYSVAAHPQFSGSNMPDSNGEDELLITYCINGYSPCQEPCSDGRANPDYYRPRGIRVPLERIAAIAKNDRKTTSNFNIDFTVEEAPEWTALFNRTSGWGGADGIFTIPVNGVNKAGSADSTLFIFSDTMIGEIEDGELQPGWSMVNNTVGYLRGNDAREDRFRFYWDKNDEGKPRALFIPDTPSAEKGDYYWLGDGFVNAGHNNATYIFAYRMRNLSDEEWSFSEMGNVLIVIPPGSKPPFKNHRQIETPFHFDASGAEEKGSFGAGILVNTKEAGIENPDGYVYVYGVRGKSKQLLVARVLPKNVEKFGAWRFWDGSDWNADMYKSVPVAENVSNELSVTSLSDGRYALVYQEGGMGSTVGLRIGPTPYGPFGPQMDLWKCKEPQQRNIFTYNAKAHPALSRPGELLISYNVNAFDFLNEINANPNLYRPRFIRIRFEK